MKSTLPRGILKFLLGLAVMLGVLVGYLNFFSGRIRAYEISPDGRYLAEWREYDQSSATTTNLSTVQIRTRYSPFRRSVLSGLDYLAELSLIWIDSKNLIVQCGSCGGFEAKCSTCLDGLYVERKETSWHDVRVRYTNQALEGAARARSD
jgi:hypothetical protein